MRAILMEVKSPAPGAEVAEPPDGLHQVLGAPSWKNKRTDAWAIAPGTSAPMHRHVKDAVELIFDGSTPARTPKACSCPPDGARGTAPEDGGRMFIFEIK